MSRSIAALFVILALALAACGSPDAASTAVMASPSTQVEAAASPDVAAPTAAPPVEPTEAAATVPTLTPTPEPAAVLTPLTEPGCCLRPFFFPADGQQVLFIDKPSSADPVGLYGVPLDGGPVELISERVGKVSPDGRYMTYWDETARVVVEDRETGDVWPIPSDGQEVIFSPGGTRLAWEAIAEVGPFSGQPAAISVSNIDGTDARQITTVYGGGIDGWLDESRLLLHGTQEGTAGEALFTYNVESGERVTLAESERLRTAQAAPGGEWVYYAVLHDTSAPEQNGQWVVSADGSQRHQLELTGGVQWRDGSHLLIVPMELDAASHRLVQLDVGTGEYTDLTDPAETPFRILAAEWAASPGGDYVVFVSSEDEALWSMRLPDLP